jgi:hypothetical protein
VLRHLSHVLIGTAAVALLAATAMMLLSGLADRLTGGRALRLVAFDAAIPAGGFPVRVSFVLQDADRDKPFGESFLFARFSPTQTVRAWVSGKGFGEAAGVGALPSGRASYEIAFSETDARMDVRARGALWAEPADRPSVWVDAAALLRKTRPSRAGRTADLSAAPSALAALKRLAAGRQAVYLVATEVRAYAAVRRRLAEEGYPPGPVLWVRPEAEPRDLAALKRHWPRAAAALVCSPELASAAERLNIRTWRVPLAGESEAEPVEGASSWADVIQELAPK